jgi:hypothetical protein
MNPFSFSTYFPSYKNPANAAMPYLQQTMGKVSPYYQPFIDTGTGAMNQLYGNAQQLATPGGATDILNQMGQGFSMNPGQQQAMQNATTAANQSAAAGGMAGSPSSQLALANQINNMSYSDYNDYMNQALGLYGMGNQDLGDLTHLGYQASDQMGDDWMKNLSEQAGLSYAGVANQNKMKAMQAQQASGLLGGLGSALGSLPWSSMMSSLPFIYTGF